MKKLLYFIIAIICIVTFMGIEKVNAQTVASSDVNPSTYIIGKYMFTRSSNQNSGYDGKLTTKRIMLASRTITSNTEEGMIIYYKNARGNWINALTGATVTPPTTFEIEVIDGESNGSITLSNPNYETYDLASANVYGSTYVIGDYIYTRNKNTSHNYDGRLTTQRIMLASKTITASTEEGMIIYYKSARGQWIDALTGATVTPPTTYTISMVDLINQKTERMEADLIDSYSFNQKIKRLAGNSSADNYSEDHNIKRIQKASSLTENSLTDDNKISLSTSNVEVYAWYNNGTIYYYPKHYFDNVDIYLYKFSSLMFYNLKKVESIDLSGLNTSKVTSMDSMFKDCSSLTSLNLSNLNTSNVTTMYYMFSGCSSLTSIDLSKFNTSKVTSMTSMFDGCSSLTSIDLSKFDTSEVLYTSYMFRDCHSIKKLDLSKFDLSKVTSANGMIRYMNALNEVKTPKVNASFDIAFSKTMYDTSNNEYTKISSNTPTETTLITKTTLISGTEFNQKIKILAGNSEASYSTTDENIKKIKRETNKNNIPTGVVDNENNIISTKDSYYDVYVWYSEGIIHYYSDANEIFLQKESSSMFRNLEKVTEIDLSIFNTSNVTNMSYMFKNCNSLTNINLSGFNTSNVTNMTYMFDHCSSLTNLNVSNFNTSNVTNMQAMFSYCSNISSLDLSSFDMSGVSNTYLMINMGSLSELKTPKVNSDVDIDLFKTMYDSYDNEYTKITKDTPTKITLKTQTKLLSGRDFNKKIKRLAGNNITTSNSPDENITKIKRETNKNNVPNEVIGNEDNIVSANDSYYDVYAWYSGGIIYYYTDANIVYLNENSSYLFNYLTKVTEIDVNIFDTSKVKFIDMMFYKCNSLPNIDLSGFNTKNVINMDGMFSFCKSLIRVDLSYFDMSSVTSASSMFSNMDSLREIKTPKTNVNIDIDISKTMFDSTGNEYDKITTSTPTKTILKTKTRLMKGDNFNKTIKQLAGNSSPTISTADENITKIKRETNKNNIPSGVTSNSNNIVSELDSYYDVYAWYNGGTIYYYTDSNSVILNQDSRFMFDYLTKVTEIDIDIFDTSQVIYMNRMFHNCNSLTSLNLSSFNTSQVTQMQSVFEGCSSLESVDLSSFNTSEVIYMDSIFEGCSSLASINLSNFNTSKVKSVYRMFSGCSSITSLDLSSFDLSSVTSVSTMLYDTRSLTQIKTPKVNPSIDIDIFHTLYDSSGNSYTKITSNTPTNTILKTSWE